MAKMRYSKRGGRSRSRGRRGRGRTKKVRSYYVARGGIRL